MLPDATMHVRLRLHALTAAQAERTFGISALRPYRSFDTDKHQPRPACRVVAASLGLNDSSGVEQS
jgi:hypothetical protein